ncbi:DUF4123 domain-containing protein [Pseudomonas saxonica]|uniref:DUF4123 domain-containing protein n=1 Tax=Pseudomonas saxonica TaxID=2600598 RepID=A0ABY3GLC9_9PSED|nr:DUF4123 domain-containing protein [Pseudomonas saxonica]TWR92513.1 DUF4123 domain-containing protein [Pseudomonas saxonica]
MTTLPPDQWLEMQRRHVRDVCLILNQNSESLTSHTLLNGRPPDTYCSVYSQTLVSRLASAGPFIIVLNSSDREQLTQLFNTPEGNWGWLASIASGDLPALAQHWRARCLAGAAPHQVLYRFEDNRVLNRALAHLSPEQQGAYLGPAISVCRWQDEHWAITDNPTPGEHPLSETLDWLNIPPNLDKLDSIHALNAHRHVLDKHYDQYRQLAARQMPFAWLKSKRNQAFRWGWRDQQKLEFLFTRSLDSPEFELPRTWYPRDDEDPATHFARVSHLANVLTIKGRS